MDHLIRGEHIPWWLLYPPVIVYGLFLSIRYRSVTLPTAANPGICTGGAFGESKAGLLHDLCQEFPDFTAKTELIEGNSLESRVVSLNKALSILKIGFPIILKPDVGQGGLAVEVARNLEQAKEYLQRFNNPVLVQEYIAGPYEVGVYYVRFPNQAHGSIIDITEKQFPVVKGDGQSSVESLILRDGRARLFAAKYLEQVGSRSQEVLPKGSELRICERGNWVQGCLFFDGQRLWSPALEARIDEISIKMNGFFIGRYDIRYEDEEDLLSGRALKIVEINGILSIPTSLKDPETRIWRAWSLLCRVVYLVYTVGAQNRSHGHRPMTVLEFARAFLDARRQMANLARK